jgi:DNA-binding Lrp family transcriptional regulator
MLRKVLTHLLNRNNCLLFILIRKLHIDLILNNDIIYIELFHYANNVKKVLSMEKIRNVRTKKNNNVLQINKEFILPIHKTPVELDVLDRALIELQQEDPFFSFNEFADKWGITATTVRNRIKRLKTQGVIDVVTVINPYKVGFNTYAIIGIKIKANAAPGKLVETLQEVGGVSGITMVAGSFDFFITYVCHNMSEYQSFNTEILRNIPEIESFESYIGLDLFERKFLVGLVK